MRLRLSSFKIEGHSKVGPCCWDLYWLSLLYTSSATSTDYTSISRHDIPSVYPRERLIIPLRVAGITYHDRPVISSRKRGESIQVIAKYVWQNVE